MSFAISDKVVCVESFEPDPHFHDPMGRPVKDGLYVIRGFFDNGNAVGLQLVGLITVYKKTEVETGWRQERFRKLTDIQAENRARAELEAVR